MSADELRADNERMREALREIRRAAGGALNFTNRLQFIHARAGYALDGMPWDDGVRQRERGYKVRERTMEENDRLRAIIAGQAGGQG